MNILKKKIGGYAGKILRVNLTTNSTAKEPVFTYAKRFLGGRGVNSYLFFKEMKPKTDAFDPENMLIFGTGPLVGSMAPMSCRFTVTSKSPLSGMFGDSNSGGHFGPELKFAGFDHVVIVGRAQKPVYLFISNNEVEIKDATKIWNATTFETDAIVRESEGDSDVQVASIGPAGENLVRYANIICNQKRAAGRAGLGAVMGSKNLKAIAVRGDGFIEVPDPEKFMKVVDDKLQIITSNEELKRPQKLGNMGLVKVTKGIEHDTLRNYQGGCFNLDDISGEKLFEKYHVSFLACFNCPVHCSQYLKNTKGRWAAEGPGMEYNAAIDFGFKLDITDLEFIVKAQIFSNQYGIDMDDASGLIAWGIECYQRGIIGLDKTGGLELNWSDPDTVMLLLENIVYRKGFGNILADGLQRASRRIGKGSRKYAMHIKGLTVMDALRSYKGWMLGEAVSPRGAEHLRGAVGVVEQVEFSKEIMKKEYGLSSYCNPSTYTDKPELVIFFERLSAIVNSLNLCYFTSKWTSPFLLGFKDYAELVSAATGWNFNEKKLLKIADRISNIEKAFNIREGWKRTDDNLPVRFFKEPVHTGPMKGEYIDKKKFKKMLDKYYELRGWDEKGLPLDETLNDLGLQEVVAQLKTTERLRFDH